MREIFAITIQTDGNCILLIRTPADRISEISGTQLNDDGVPLKESEITKKLLGMLANAYYAGYEEATEDGTDAVRRLLLETSKHRKPNTKITEKIDYRI